MKNDWRERFKKVFPYGQNAVEDWIEIELKRQRDEIRKWAENYESEGDWNAISVNNILAFLDEYDKNNTSK